MTLFASYRARLIASTVVLMAFIVLTLAYVHTQARALILSESAASVDAAVRVFTSNVRAEEQELRHYADIITDDPSIQQHMLMTQLLGTDGEALAAVYGHHFGWLPVSRHALLTLDGLPITSDADADAEFAATLKRQQGEPRGEIFYFSDAEGLAMAVWSTVHYQGQPVGSVLLSRTLDQSWLTLHNRYIDGHLFMVNEGRIVLSTLENAEAQPFVPQQGSVTVFDHSFAVNPIPLLGDRGSTPLWLATAESDVLAKLDRQRNFVGAFAIAGCLVVLGVALLILRNFNRPLNQLMAMTRAIAAGDLPQMERFQGRDEISRLANRFAEMVQALRRQQQEIAEAQQRLEEIAIRDSLTETYNRHYLKEVFPKLLAQAQRESRMLSAILLDLDNFKGINDTYGHLCGDHCLLHFTGSMRQTLRASDYLFRIGGEEFLVLSISDDLDGPQATAEKLRAMLEANPMRFEQQEISLTTSAGVASAPLDGPADKVLSGLLSRADKALYQAKRQGRNQVRVFEERPTTAHAAR